MNQQARRAYLIKKLLPRQVPVPEDEATQKIWLRSLMNIRPPYPIDEEFLKVQDEYLQEELSKKKITDIQDLEPVQDGIYLWQGDITTLKCDAIVNAANEKMTGCYIPCHGCIDNAIHTYAGVQLRLECARIMALQGHDEKTGTAKITPAYNLPCRYVIHTVGPIIADEVSAEDEKMLISCYRSCLELARRHHLESIAFCCLSTGEFHFPNELAADIAIDVVRAYRREMKVIFNVYKDRDYEIYKARLG